MTKKIIFIFVLMGLFLLPLWIQGQNRYRVIIQSPFQPVGELTLDYPEELKKEGVASRFVLNININKKGHVNYAFVWKSQHPELEKRLVDAAYKWKFEPFIHRGEPLPAHGWLKVIFYPESVKPQIEKAKPHGESIKETLEEPYCGELKTVLDECADYCQKLSDYALYYVCLEKIDEKFKRVTDEYIGTLSSGGGPDLYPDEHLAAKLYQLMLKGTEKDAYIYDYQLIRKYGKIDEKRALLGSTDREKGEKDAISGAKLSYSIQPILVPVRLLCQKRHYLFSYRLAKDEKVMGRKSYVIEVQPKSEQAADIIQGKVWVDKENYRILKVEVESSYIEGYEEVYEECSKHYLTPHFTLTHLYEIEKNGIMFPSRSEIRIEYFGLLKSKRELKSKADITYNSYRFFTVDVDHNIIKKKIKEFFSKHNKNNLSFEYSFKIFSEIIRQF